MINNKQIQVDITNQFKPDSIINEIEKLIPKGDKEIHTSLTYKIILEINYTTDTDELKQLKLV